MLHRIVKMTFQPERIEDFLSFFHERKHKIAGFPGCQSLRLLQDIKHDNVVFTYSIWEKEEDLEAYRHSELFIDTWKITKAMFAEKAQAWSVDSLVYLHENGDNS